MTTKWLWVPLIAAGLACSHSPATGTDGGGDAGSNGDGGGGSPDSGGADGGGLCADPQATCTSFGVACGALSLPCGTVDCGTCAFNRTTVTSGTTNPAMVSTPNGLVLAFGRSNGIAVAKEAGDGGWNIDIIDAAGTTSPGLASAADGTLWLTYATTGTATIRVTHSVADGGPDGGPYVFEDLPQGSFGTFPAIALAADGTPHVVFDEQVFSTYTVHHDVRSGTGTWQDQAVEVIDGGVGLALGMPAVVVDSSAQAHAFYLVAGSGLHHATQGASGFTVETVDSIGSIYSQGQLSAAIDSTGALHAVWPDSPFVLKYGVKPAGSSWQVSVISSQNADTNNALTLDSANNPRIAFFEQYGSALTYAQGSGGNWSTQLAAGSCNPGGTAIAFDSSANLRIAGVCQPDMCGLFVLTAAGTFPSDHDSKCNQIAQGICQDACSCSGDGGSCCRLNDSSGSSCPSPSSYCVPYVSSATCDPSRTTSQLDACLADVASLTCAGPDAGVALGGSPCDVFFQCP